MAEALAALGAAAAAAQFADAALRCLVEGSQLISRFKEAPHKIQRSLGQLRQMLAITNLIEQLNGQSFPGAPPTLLESILRECVKEASKLRTMLEKLAVNGKSTGLERFWARVVTIKREHELDTSWENHRRTLMMWLAQDTA
jgi:hypothetical protein